MNPKLAPLVRMLAAPHDGEVLATVATIRRTLAAGGQDLHDLAAVIEANAPAATAPRFNYRTYSDGYAAGQAAPRKRKPRKPRAKKTPPPPPPTWAERMARRPAWIVRTVLGTTLASACGLLAIMVERVIQ
jgi:hypothetical protein